MKTDPFFDSKKKDLVNVCIQLRKKKNITQKELGEKIGIERTVLNKFERKIRPTTFDFICKVLKGLDHEVFFHIKKS